MAAKHFKFEMGGMMKPERKLDSEEMQDKKRPKFNCNKTWCPDESASAGSLFILSPATAENMDS